MVLKEGMVLLTCGVGRCWPQSFACELREGIFAPTMPRDKGLCAKIPMVTSVTLSHWVTDSRDDRHRVDSLFLSTWFVLEGWHPRLVTRTSGCAVPMGCVVVPRSQPPSKERGAPLQAHGGDGKQSGHGEEPEV
jgi:hypothetical protein